MSRTLGMTCAALPLFAALFVAAGCQKARPYPANIPGKTAAKDKQDARAAGDEATVPESYAWMDTGREPVQSNDVRIEFVHEGTSPDEWKKLTGYWTDPAVAKVAGLIGLPGLHAAALAADKTPPAIKLKVPLGLEDPLSYIPASNPPTKAKWELGRKLFFDAGWLTAKGGQSCASCHDPGKGFTDGKEKGEGDYNVPTLVNVVYNTHQFWDGRATNLEEVVQRSLDDERPPAEAGTFRHVWHGVIGRLRASKPWAEEFNKTFGTAATQDAVGKALATYLRTLLVGDSLHDRAVAAQQKKGARKLLAEHYEAVLDDAAMVALRRAKEAKAKVAADLARGAELFRGKAECASCHPPGNGNYSDGRFYNIGVEADRVDAEKGARLGRFARAPYGEKSRYLKGAYKVPTLRGLSRTGPYFHDGSAADLVEAVRFHAKPPRGRALNLYLDPKLAGPGGEHRDLGLSEQDIADLVLFLAALDGEVDVAVRTPPR